RAVEGLGRGVEGACGRGGVRLEAGCRRGVGEGVEGWAGGDRQLRDQVFGVRVAQGGGEPERGGVCGGHGVPIEKGGPCPGVGEQVAGQVGRVAVEDAQGLHQPGVAGGVGQDVRQAVEQDGGGRLQAVEEGAEGGPDRAGGGGGGAEQAVAAG